MTANPASTRPEWRSMIAGEALDFLLRRNPWAMRSLAPFAGQTISILPGEKDVWLGLQAHFSIGGEGGLHAVAAAEKPADVVLTVPAGAWATLPLDRTRFFDAVSIQGSAGLAETLAAVFRHLEWDIEDDLAKLTGDIIAHRAVSTARALSEAARQRFDALCSGASGERTGLTGMKEWRSFKNEVGLLQQSITALGNRVGRLMDKTGAVQQKTLGR